MGDDSRDDVNSKLIALQALEGQYRNKLTEYENGYATYISALQSQKSGSSSYVVLPEKTYMGTGSISETINSSASMCEASCSANALCTGASFNSTSKVCKLRSGNSLLTPGATSDNAIITDVRQKLINLETINAQLIEINNQMTTLYNQMQPLVTTQTETLLTNNGTLTTQYSELMKEKFKIVKLMDEYKDTYAEYTETSLSTDQRNSSYYLWLIIAIISIILVIKFIFFPEAKGNLVSIILWTIIIICITLSTIHLNNPSAYAIWVFLVALVLMMKSNLIPSF
uniref:Apple domain-containing protein n=1 Tax=viral metagenome TaxID=1070528 RepID=A0A6C0JYY5_9ZZZZ